MPKTYFDRSYATVEYKSTKNLVVADMTEYAEGEEYREYMNSVVDAIEDTGCSNILADTRDHPTLDEADQSWTQKTWGPNVEEAGAERLAILAPESIISKMSIETVTENSEDDIDRQWFEKYEDGVSWLRTNS
jgi:hypothetical protein